jgi:hypothetical protein
MINALPSIKPDAALQVYYANRPYDKHVQIISYGMGVTVRRIGDMSKELEALDQIAVHVLNNLQVPLKVVHKQVTYNGLGHLTFRICILRMDAEGNRIYRAAMAHCGLTELNN